MTSEEGPFKGCSLLWIENANGRLSRNLALGKEHHLEDEEPGGLEEPDGNLWIESLFCIASAVLYWVLIVLG